MVHLERTLTELTLTAPPTPFVQPARVMSAALPRVGGQFAAECDAIYATDGPRKALSHVHAQMVQTGYIQAERLKLNLFFAPQPAPGFEGCTLEVSINCSKPEIVAGVARPKPPMPAGARCVICPQHIGVKPGLRGWDVQVAGRPFFIQAPPYPYCELHSVLVETEHTPQKIQGSTLVDVADAAATLRGLYICSNTDLSGTGASVLQHRHYQIVGKRLGICDAKATLSSYSGGRPNSAVIEFLSFPVAAARVVAPTAAAVVEVGTALLNAWRSDAMAAALGVPVAELTASFICSQPGVGDGFELIVIPRAQQNATRASLRCIKAECVAAWGIDL